MEKELLIKKWLDNDLTEKELDDFKKLDDYKELVKLSDAAAHFKAPEFEEAKEWPKLEAKLQEKRAQVNWMLRLKPYAKIAVIIVFGFFVYNLFLNKNLTIVETLAANKDQVILPDNSIVDLNSLSTVQFLKKDWPINRKVSLEGEAFFNVEKGSKFDVETAAGRISVLGTKFNVKNRKNYFEVACFEGRVRVSTTSFTLELTAGETMRLVDNKLVEGTAKGARPTWLDNSSTFKSVPYSEVLSEFERQYNVVIQTDQVVSEIFTGSFDHTNMNLALKSITIPFNLSYKIEENLIILYKAVE